MLNNVDTLETELKRTKSLLARRVGDTGFASGVGLRGRANRMTDRDTRQLMKNNIQTVGDGPRCAPPPLRLAMSESFFGVGAFSESVELIHQISLNG